MFILKHDPLVGKCIQTGSRYWSLDKPPTFRTTHAHIIHLQYTWYLKTETSTSTPKEKKSKQHWGFLYEQKQKPTTTRRNSDSGHCLKRCRACSAPTEWPKLGCSRSHRIWPLQRKVWTRKGMDLYLSFPRVPLRQWKSLVFEYSVLPFPAARPIRSLCWHSHRPGLH